MDLHERVLADAKQLTTRVQALLEEHEKTPAKTQRFVIERPEELVLLAAWIEARPVKMGSEVGNFLDVSSITSGVYARVVSNLVRRYITAATREALLHEVEALENGKHSMLQR